MTKRLARSDFGQFGSISNPKTLRSATTSQTHLPQTRSQKELGTASWAFPIAPQSGPLTTKDKFSAKSIGWGDTGSRRLAK